MSHWTKCWAPGTQPGKLTPVAQCDPGLPSMTHRQARFPKPNSFPFCMPSDFQLGQKLVSIHFRTVKGMAPRESITGESKNCKHPKHRTALLATSQECSHGQQQGHLCYGGRDYSQLKYKNSAQESLESQPTSSWMRKTGLAPTGQHWVKTQQKAKQVEWACQWYPWLVYCVC